MTVHLRDALATLPAYAPGRTVPGAIKLASNEMPFPPLPGVVEAVAAAVGGTNRYPDITSGALVDDLAAFLDVPAEQIVIGCGSVALCQQVIQATCGAGDEVLFGWRSFEAYPIVTAIAGANSIKVALAEGENLDIDACIAAVTERTRVAFLCNPNNPTGTALTAEQITRFLDAVSPEVLVIIDEAYREFVDDATIPDGIAIGRDRPNVAVLRTLSKAYGLAGVRVGYAVGSPEFAVALRKVAVPFAVNAVAQAAARAALAAQEEVAARCAVIVAERARVRQALLDLGFAVPPSQANFVWLPLREQSAAFAAHCEANGVIVRPFSEPGTGGVRVTVSVAEENDRFLAAAGSWQG